MLAASNSSAVRRGSAASASAGRGTAASAGCDAAPAACAARAARLQLRGRAHKGICATAEGMAEGMAEFMESGLLEQRADWR